MPVTKPSWRGNISPALVAPDWRWAWKDLLVYFPIWNTSSPVLYDAARRILVPPAGGGPTAQPSQVGTVVDFNGTSDYYSLGSETAGRVNINSGTMVFYAQLDPDAPAVSTRALWEIGNSGETNNFFGLRRVSADNQVTFRYRAGGTNYDAQFGSAAEVAGAFTVFVGVYTPTRVKAYANGVLINDNARSADVAVTMNQMHLGHEAQGGLNQDRFDGKLAVAAFWNRAMSDAEVKRISADPFGPIRPRLWGPELVTATGVTGTIAATETDDTMAASGAVAISGSLAATEEDDSAAAAGAVLISGTVAATEENDTVAASGGVLISGSITVTEADDTLAASGKVLISGSMAWTEEDDTMLAQETIVVAPRIRTGTLTATRNTASVTSGRKAGRLT